MKERPPKGGRYVGGGDTAATEQRPAVTDRRYSASAGSVKLAPTDPIEPPPCPLLNQEGKLVYEL
jgi:hypothetical protein